MAELVRIETSASRPAPAWIAVATALALVAIGLVAWRALASREAPRTKGILFGAAGPTLGYDGRGGSPFWLNIAGPRSYTFDGDPYTAGCTGTSPGIVRSNRPGATSETSCQPNPNLDRRGHLFVVRVTRAESERPLLIDVADPRLRPTSGRSGSGCPTAGATAPSSRGAICAGDLAPRGTGFATTFIVRAPDSTPDDPTDNPAICATTFAADTNGSSTAPTDWERMCAIPPNRVQVGDYIVQVRSNADLSSPRESRTADLDPAAGAGSLERADPTAAGDGQNHFALRAQWDGGADENRGQSLTVEGLNHLVTFVSQRSSLVTLPLLNLSSVAAGRTLRLKVFDLGDLANPNQQPSNVAANGNGNSTASTMALRLVAPSQALVGNSPMREMTGCRFTFGSDTLAGTGRGSSCGVDNAPRSAFNGKEVTVEVQLPAGYTCEATVAGCWLNAELDYRGAPNDGSAWSAELIDPSPPSTAPPTTR